MKPTQNTINEVITMISQKIFAKRREQVLKQINSHGIVIIPAAKEVIRSGDTHYYFRQDSNFYYLTGFEEPDAILVLIPQYQQGEYILFVREADPAKEIWDGKMAGTKGAKAHYHADIVYDINTFKEKLPTLLENRQFIYSPVGKDQVFDQMIFEAVEKLRPKERKGIKAADIFHNINAILSEMRLIKTPEEIELMQKAADISVNAHKRAMRVCKPGMYEYELEAELMHEFYKNGARAPAYTTIIGSGENTCTLHYISNNKQIQDDELILIDAGCEYHNYASDITRTFPANGKFSKEQAAIYNLVLQAQIAAINMIKPGLPWFEIQTCIIELFTKGLRGLGLLKGDVNQLIASKAVARFYMHSSGHWLGLDTHDVGNYKIDDAWRPLQAGMVLTVEPGIYIPANQSDIDKKWWNIGVRIEDDVLVTENGHQVLTQALPKTVEAIEALMSEKK